MGFFQAGYAVGYGKALRLLHSSYGLEYVLKRPLSNVTKLLEEAIDHDEDSLVTTLWASLYPFVSLGWLDFVPYAEFKSKMLNSNPKLSNKRPEEIEDEMNRVIAQYESTKAVI